MPEARRGIDALGGNMPFLGGRRIATQHGERYAEWLAEAYGCSGDTDYVGYFFHRARALMGERGTLGFIATNAIADGDNRRTVLGNLVAVPKPFRIFAAETGLPWPGNAEVLVSTLFMERGLPENVARPYVLNGRGVESISSLLRSGTEWPEPEALAENAGLALVGCFLRGSGFILEQPEAEALLRCHPHEAEVIRPFLTGDDLNNSVGQQAQRFVIDFGDRSLAEARRYPRALALVEERVRPGRERLKTTGADAEHRKYWWRFANVRKELREQAARVPRLLGTARVSKHSLFAFIPASWTSSEQVVVFPLPSWTAFGVLQSRIHGAWVTFQATHMGEGLRYSAGECFAPYPFPERAPRTVLPSLEAAGERLYEARREFMNERGLGLTETYNLLNDRSASDAAIEGLRALHVDLDRAVLTAYGWADVSVPPFGIVAPDFEDAVGARLFALNVQRRAAPIPARPGPRKARPRAEPKASSRKKASA